MRAICPPISYSLIWSLVTIFGEEYKSRSSSLCSLIQPPTTSSLESKEGSHKERKKKKAEKGNKGMKKESKRDEIRKEGRKEGK
jgi:hypothetical protein